MFETFESVFDLQSKAACSFKGSWNSPLYDPYGNSLNPCFLASVIAVVNVFFILPIVWQMAERVLFNSFGPYKIKYSFGSVFKAKSVGIFNLMKFNSLFIQCLLTLILLSFELKSFDVKTTALLIKSFTLILLVTPFHLLEPTRSVAASTSLLFYWLVDAFINLVIVIQDSFSPYKVFIPKTDSSGQSAVLVVEIFLFLNAVVILFLQSSWYQPSVELIEYFELNGWNPQRERNIFVRLYFTFLQDTINTARETNHVDVDKLPPYIIDVDNEVAYNRFSSYWNKSVQIADKKNRKNFESCKKSGKPFVKTLPSLTFPLLKLSMSPLACGLFFDSLEMIVSVCQPFLLKKFLLFATNRYLVTLQKEDGPIVKEPIIVGISVATGIYVLSVLKFIAFNRLIVNAQTMGDIINTALSTHLYNKGMKLSPKSRKSKSVGEIVNNMAQDVSQLQGSPFIIVDIFIQPIRLVLYIVTLYNFMGIASIAGLVAAIVIIPFASASYVLVIKEYKKVTKFKDARSKLTSEILNSIKSIKFYSWEESMLERLSEIRNGKELVTARKISVLSAVITFVWDSIPLVIALATFVCAVALSSVVLTPPVIFPALTLFNSLSEPLLQLPNIFNMLSLCKVSVDRLVKSFVMQDLEVSGYEKTESPMRKGQDTVIIKDATFIWDSSNEEEKAIEELAKKSKVVDEEANVESEEPENAIALHDINYTVKKGDLACVVGKVGSGKTTFLKAILGCVPLETKDAHPVLKVNGSVAYCAQSAWILNSSVRENIIFGRKYDPDFYKTVIDACELTKDFDVLPDGDRTIVGEKGISLSGGQKARISLARAVYSKADVYVLDDVLSAVDTHVGKNITKNVLGKHGLLGSKTTILATNAVSVLHEADDIVLLSGGKITERGPYDEVMSTESELATLIKEFGKKEDTEEETKEPEVVLQVQPVSEVPSSSASTDENIVTEFKPDADEDLALKRVETNATVAASFVSFGHNYVEDFNDDPETVNKTGDTEEITNKGKVNLAIYKKYIEACGYGYCGLFVVVMVISSVAVLLNSFILKHWSEENAKNGVNSRVVLYLMLYAGAGIVGGLCTLVSSFVLYALVAINGSKYFHDTMARSVLKSPMSFFETTPVGRILNRFIEDIGVIDNGLLWVIHYFAMLFFGAISMFVVVILNLPLMVLVILGLLYFYNNFRQSFISASREFKRIRSAKKSPIYSHLQESVTGVDTLVAYGQLDRFKYRASNNLNQFILVTQSNLACDRWLSMRLQGLSSMVVYVSTLLIVAGLLSQHPLGPGLVGLLMTYILNVTSTLNAITRMYAELENKSITLERILEYCNLTPEAPSVIEETSPADSWPEQGSVSFKGYETRYRANLDPVLKNLDIDIKPQEKIGIVGRTGAGKSTLTLAIFRIIEATHGHIEIDGVDTSKLGLFDLRSKLNIIPQDSQAVHGSVRENLDPLKKHTDDELWKVLELSHLKEHVETMKTEEKKDDDGDDKEPEGPKTYVTGLNAIVEEGGGNLSAGQKQLLCLARALLNPSKILILDEATASVDVRTDKIVQDTIRSEFKDKTILTIAHRIETIMDSDRILVLDKGEVKEFDAPQELLKDTDGIFYSLCKQGGHI